MTPQQQSQYYAHHAAASGGSMYEDGSSQYIDDTSVSDKGFDAQFKYCPFAPFLAIRSSLLQALPEISV